MLTRSILLLTLFAYPIYGDEFEIQRCPNLSGTYRFDGMSENCKTNDTQRAFAYPIPVAIHSQWYIQPGNTFQIEQKACDQILVHYSIDSIDKKSDPLTQTEEIALKPHTDGLYRDEHFEFSSISIEYHGKKKIQKSGIGFPEGGTSWLTQSFTLNPYPNGDLQIVSKQHDFGVSSQAPYMNWSAMNFKCRIARVPNTIETTQQLSKTTAPAKPSRAPASAASE